MATITKDELVKIITEGVFYATQNNQVNEDWKSIGKKIGNGLKTAATAGAIGAGLLGALQVCSDEEEGVDPTQTYKIEQMKKKWAEERGMDFDDPHTQQIVDDFFGPSDDYRDVSDLHLENKKRSSKPQISEARIKSIVHNTLRKCTKA